jgi:hypothetical protein
MTGAIRLWPLLTATHRYDKSISTWQRGKGQRIDAPILAYLIETASGRILYDVGCDHAKIHDPALRARYYDPAAFDFGAPEMTEEQRLPRYLERGFREGGHDEAVASIRRLKALARETGAWIWPNHDLLFYRSLPGFPEALE